MDSVSLASPPQRPSALYTPFQVRLASFLGGPFAAVYTLQRNFKELEDDRGRRLTLWWGAGFNVAVLALIPFLPDRFPNIVLPLAYSAAAGSIAASRHLSKEAILASDRYVRCTGWNVALVSLLSLLAFCAIGFSLFIVLDYLGILVS